MEHPASGSDDALRAQAERVLAAAAESERWQARAVARRRNLVPLAYLQGITGLLVVALLLLWSAYAPWPQEVFLHHLGLRGAPVQTLGLAYALTTWRLLLVAIVAGIAYVAGVTSVSRQTMRLSAEELDARIASPQWRRRQIAIAVGIALPIVGAVVAMQFYRVAEAGDTLRARPTVSQSDVDGATGGTGAWIQVVPRITYWQGNQPQNRGPVLVVPDLGREKVYVLDPKDSTTLTVSSKGYGAGGN